MQIGIGIGLQFPNGSGPPIPPNTLIAGRGVFFLTGDTMVPAYACGADQGAFALSGFGATFSQGTVPVLTAAQGSFTLTGNAATLLGANAIGASQGAFALTGEAAAFKISMPAAQGSFTLTGEAATLTAPSAYTGPGDITSGAMVWYGLRGYSAAYSTGSNPGADIVDQAGANPLTVNIKSDGTLDVAAINAWVTAHSVTTIKCSKLYDQTVAAGAGNNLVQATLANMPVLNLTAVLSAKPSLVFAASGTGTCLIGGTNLTGSVPYTMAALIEQPSIQGFGQAFGTTANPGIWFNNNASTAITAYAGGAAVDISTTAAYNAFHRVQVMFNGASSSSNVDGAVGLTGNPGTGGFTGFKPSMGGTGVSSFNITGDVCEGGIWAGDQSANFSAMDSNIKTAWGL
jgi:hypothetical protein